MKIYPTDPELYNFVKEAAKEKFRGSWPSVMGSAWLINQYKSVGGQFFGEKLDNSELTQKIRNMPSILYWPCKTDVQKEIVLDPPSFKVNINKKI